MTEPSTRAKQDGTAKPKPIKDCDGCGDATATITCVNCDPPVLVKYCAACAAWCNHSHVVKLEA